MFQLLTWARGNDGYLYVLSTGFQHRQPGDDAHVAQLYGGYVIPGSTLQDLHLSLSQWNTTAGANNIPYHAMQFRVQGLV